MSTGIKFINPTNNKINLLQRNKHEIFRMSIENRELDSSLLRGIIFVIGPGNVDPLSTFISSVDLKQFYRYFHANLSSQLSFE